jgi:hypothetical protein
MFNLKEIVENQRVEAEQCRSKWAHPGKTFLYGLSMLTVAFVFRKTVGATGWIRIRVPIMFTKSGSGKGFKGVQAIAPKPG